MRGAGQAHIFRISGHLSCDLHYLVTASLGQLNCWAEKDMIMLCLLNLLQTSTCFLELLSMPAVQSILCIHSWPNFALVLPIPCITYYLRYFLPVFQLDFWPQSHLGNLLSMSLSFSLQTFGPAPDFLAQINLVQPLNFQISVYLLDMRICGEHKGLCSLVLCFQKWLRKDYWVSLSLVYIFSFLLRVSSSLNLLDLTAEVLVVGVSQGLQLLFNIKTRILSAS